MVRLRQPGGGGQGVHRDAGRDGGEVEGAGAQGAAAGQGQGDAEAGEDQGGAIRPGELLPAAHHVAEKHGTSTATARRGLRLLAKIGFAQPVRGHPYIALHPEP
jgi:hypothetical protein